MNRKELKIYVTPAQEIQIQMEIVAAGGEVPGT